MSWLAALALLPLLAAAPIPTRRGGRLRLWLALVSAVAVMLAGLAMPLFEPDAVAVPLPAAVLALAALADALHAPARGRNAALAAQLRLAAMLLALAIPDMLGTWLALAGAAMAGAATHLPRLTAVRTRLIAVQAALGLALFGIVAVQTGSVLLGSLALLLGWAALACLDPALLPLVLLLALRLQAGLAGAPQAPLLGSVLIGVGVAAVLAAAALAWESHLRLTLLLVAGQAGLILCAFGLGGAALREAALLHLLLLGLSTAAAALASPAGLDRAAALAALIGVPPLGVFPTLAVLLGALAGTAPWLLLPFGLGFAVLVMVTLRTAPHPARWPAGSLAWVPLVLAAVIGFALPAPALSWLQVP
ncbi:MAG: hypothetical protein J0H67_06030 [Rhodospirillales bacterium]|nr:hypothetical protein [Rhodospirillales bacterium]